MACPRCGEAAPTAIRLNVGPRRATFISCTTCGEVAWEVGGESVSREALFGVRPGPPTPGRRRNRTSRQ